MRGKAKENAKKKRYPVSYQFGVAWLVAFIDEVKLSWNEEAVTSGRAGKSSGKGSGGKSSGTGRTGSGARKSRKAGTSTSMEDRVRRKRDGKFNGSEKAEDVPAPAHGKRIRLSEARKRGGAYDDASAPVAPRARAPIPGDDVAAGGRTVMARDAVGGGGSAGRSAVEQAARLRALHD